jgi:hypothetical protein
MKSIFPNPACVMIGLALLVSFGMDWANTAKGGAVDFRSRIIGARLLVHGIDPYHYKWHQGEPPEYCDPHDNPLRPVSRITVTPALLMLHLPLAVLPYRLAQFLGLIVQWLLLLGTGWLWLRASKTALTSWLVALIVMGFSFTASWRLHAERGQSYVVLAFLFAYWLTATFDPRRGNGFLAGCIAGFLAAVRPPFLLLVPFLALHRRGQMTGAAIGLLLGFGLPMLMNPACWTNYFSAMQTQSDFYRYGFKPATNHPTYPATIEGVPIDVISHWAGIPAGEFSVDELLRRFGFKPFPPLPPLLALAAAFALWLGLSRGQPAGRLLPGMAAWLFLIDLFLPAFRESYNDVLILNVVAAGLAFAPRFPWEAWPCILALPLGAAVYIFNPPHPWMINLPVALFTLSAVLFLFSFNNRAESPIDEAAP